jgi:ankyrin repeat protein
MSTHPRGAARPLPDRPNLRHLKDQAKDLLEAGDAKSLTDAQFQIARLYGFASWPKLKAHVDALEEIGQLKQAIDTNDVESVKALMIHNPELHRAPIQQGRPSHAHHVRWPLTWAAECRVPWGPPNPARLAIAKWMIENGSDVHQDGDAPLGRAALNDSRIPMMELLVAHGADVNALSHGHFPILFAPCEALAPTALKWLLDHGANPNGGDPSQRPSGTALDYVIGTYARSPHLAVCIDILLGAGGVTRYDAPAVLELLRNRLDRLAELLDADAVLVHRRFTELDFGNTGERRLTLKEATLLHVAAEYGNLEAARLLLQRGADANAPATVDEAGIGGQTPIFHAVTQFHDWGLPVAELLVENGADLSVRVKLPGHYERPEEVVHCTPLGYALLFPGGEKESGSATLLRERGAVE